MGTVLGATPSPLRDLRPDLPEGLDALVARCLERDARHRFAEVGEHRAAAAVGVVAVGAPPRIHPRLRQPGHTSHCRLRAQPGGRRRTSRASRTY